MGDFIDFAEALGGVAENLLFGESDDVPARLAEALVTGRIFVGAVGKKEMRRVARGGIGFVDLDVDKYAVLFVDEGEVGFVVVASDSHASVLANLSAAVLKETGEGDEFRLSVCLAFGAGGIGAHGRCISRGSEYDGVGLGHGNQ